jgi:GAF domain-containing protein
MVVEDASRDPRFEDNPLVTESPGVRFYAGAPLVTPNDDFLGALRVLDTTPRTCSPDDLEVLKDLAGIVSDELELRAAHQKLERRTRQAESLAEALTQAEETERRRLSQLLHDDLQQVLHSARTQIETLRGERFLSERESKRVDQVETKISEATEITRTLSTRFAPRSGRTPYGTHSTGWRSKCRNPMPYRWRCAHAARVQSPTTS